MCFFTAMVFLALGHYGWHVAERWDIWEYDRGVGYSDHTTIRIELVVENGCVVKFIRLLPLGAPA